MNKKKFKERNHSIEDFASFPCKPTLVLLDLLKSEEDTEGTWISRREKLSKDPFKISLLKTDRNIRTWPQMGKGIWLCVWGRVEALGPLKNLNYAINRLLWLNSIGKLQTRKTYLLMNPYWAKCWMLQFLLWLFCAVQLEMLNEERYFLSKLFK